MGIAKYVRKTWKKPKEGMPMLHRRDRMASWRRMYFPANPEADKDRQQPEDLDIRPSREWYWSGPESGVVDSGKVRFT